MPSSRTQTRTLPSVTLDLQMNTTASVRVLRRVVEQIAEHLRETRHVAVDDQGPRGNVDREIVPGGIDERLTDLERMLQDRLEIDRRALQLDLAAADAAHFEQIVDEVHHLLELTSHHHARLLGDFAAAAW